MSPRRACLGVLAPCSHASLPSTLADNTRAMRFHPIYLPRWRYASGESGLTSNDYGPKESDKIEAAHQLWLNTKEPARRRMRIILNMTHGVRFDSPNKATQYRLDDTQRTCRVWRELRRVWCEQEPTGAPCKALPVAESKKEQIRHRRPLQRPRHPARLTKSSTG